MLQHDAQAQRWTGSFRIVAATIIALVLLGIWASVAHASDSLALTPSNAQAGGDPNLTAAFGFTYASGSTTDTVQNLSLTLPPGLELLPAAPSAACTSKELTANTCPAASLIGTGTATVNTSTQLTADLYATAAPSAADIGGVGIVLSESGVTGTTTVSASGPIDLTTNSSGAPVETVTLNDLPQSVPSSLLGISLGTTAIQLNALLLTINGTTASATGTATTTAFTRMPATCAAASVNETITTYTAADDGMASGTITPTGCGSLAFTPSIVAAGIKDSTDSGVEVAAVLSQAAGQAPSKAVALTFPADLIPSGAGFRAAVCTAPNATFSNCTKVGAASLATPLAATALPASAYLTSSSTALMLTLVFPAPYAFTLTGTLTDTGGPLVATFPAFPDLPTTEFGLLLTGGSDALLTSTCASTTGTLSTALTAQNGLTASPSAAFSLSGCTSTTTKSTTPTTTTSPGKPRLSSVSLRGLASGKATLSFHATAGTHGAPKLSVAAVRLPSGVSFVKTKLKHAVTVSGGQVTSVSLSGGTLIVTLKRPSASFTVRVGSAALKVTKGLARQVKRHKTKSVVLTIAVKGAAGAGTGFMVHVKV